jgi:hypothetical protein
MSSKLERYEDGFYDGYRAGRNSAHGDWMTFALIVLLVALLLTALV